MRPRYRGGVVLGKPEFAAQPWLKGFLFLQPVKGRPQLGLYPSNVPSPQQPAIALLWRPELAGCFSDTISFSGFERVEKRWCYQVWFCESHGGSA